MKKFVIFLNLYQSLAFIKAKLFGYRSLGFVKLLCCFVLFAISLYTLHIIERQSIFHSVAFAQFDIDFSNWSGSDDSSPPGGCDGGSDVCGGGESKPTQPSQPQNDSPLGGWDPCSFLPCGDDSLQTSNKSSTKSSSEEKSRQTFCDIFGIGCGGDDTQTADKQVGSGSKAPGPGAQSGGCYLGFICPDAKGQYCFGGLCTTPKSDNSKDNPNGGSNQQGGSYSWDSPDCLNDPECQNIWNEVCKYKGLCGNEGSIANTSNPLNKCKSDPECDKNEALKKKIVEFEAKKAVPSGTSTKKGDPNCGANTVCSYCTIAGQSDCDKDDKGSWSIKKNEDANKRYSEFFCKENPLDSACGGPGVSVTPQPSGPVDCSNPIAAAWATQCNGGGVTPTPVTKFSTTGDFGLTPAKKCESGKCVDGYVSCSEGQCRFSAKFGDTSSGFCDQSKLAECGISPQGTTSNVAPAGGAGDAGGCQGKTSCPTLQ